MISEYDPDDYFSAERKPAPTAAEILARLDRLIAEVEAIRAMMGGKMPPLDAEAEALLRDAGWE